MEDIKSYRDCFEVRFHVRPINFWYSLFSFFTQTSPYDKAIDKIQKMDIKDAFRSDAQQLHRDFHHACKKQHFDLLGVDCSDKLLADACE